MAFLEGLLTGGDDYLVTMGGGGATFQPKDAGADALTRFQDVVALLDQHDGDGYDIHIRHQTSERGSGLVDMVLIALAGEDD